MRTMALVALFLAGCTAVPVTPVAPARSSAPTPAATAAPAASAVGRPTPSPTESPEASPDADTASTTDDEELEKRITAGAERAIPELRSLNDSDPSALDELFRPLGIWITDQRASLEGYRAGRCTATAVAMFIEGLDRYDEIRKQFLAWRDWGAHGHAFPPGAPREAADAFRGALALLEARCPA